MLLTGIQTQNPELQLAMLRKGKSVMTTKTLLKKLLSESVDTCTALEPHNTGLPIRIWISENEGDRKNYRPRIRVMEADLDMAAAISIDNPIKILEGGLPAGALRLLTKYIKLNQNMLLLVWNAEMTYFTFTDLHQILGRRRKAVSSRTNEMVRKFRREIIAERSQSYHFGNTGLPFAIWVCDCWHARGVRHRPRLKVMSLSQDATITATVSLDDPIEVLEGELPLDWFRLLTKHIRLNRKILLELWSSEISIMNFVRRQMPITHKPIEFVRASSSETNRPVDRK